MSYDPDEEIWLSGGFPPKEYRRFNLSGDQDFLHNQYVNLVNLRLGLIPTQTYLDQLQLLLHKLMQRLQN